MNFTFSQNVTMSPTGLVLLVSFDPVGNPAELAWFRNAYGVLTNVPVFGPWSGSLADEGEDIQLLKPDPPQLPPHPDAGFVPYVLVEHVHYLPADPWPTNGAGAGFSLQRRVPEQFGNEPLNWFTAAPSPGRNTAADSDGDGLPDYWEKEFGLDAADSSGANGASGDPDGDGQINQQEFLAGTNPHDEADYLHFESVSRTPDGTMLRFRAAGGRLYSVLYSDASPAGPWLKLVDAPASGNTLEVQIIDAGVGVASRFYRLVTPALTNP